MPEGRGEEVKAEFCKSSFSRFTGEFYTPVEFASKGLDYLERELGQRWWESGEYRFWDMAAGTGNLEFELPAAALPYCYISTLEDTEAKCCQKIFPLATCFQYNYLEDDVASLEGGLDFGGSAPRTTGLFSSVFYHGKHGIRFTALKSAVAEASCSVFYYGKNGNLRKKTELVSPVNQPTEECV